MKHLRYILLVALTLGSFSSCKKLLEYPPEGAILAEDAIKTPEDLQRLLNSCYDVMANVFDGSFQNMAELMSDNLAEPTGNDFKAIYNRSTNFFTPYPGSVYADFYYTIYRCNSLIENFDLVLELGETDRNRMEAEARFLRGLCHWYVANIWAQPYGYTLDNSHMGIVIRDHTSHEPLPRNTLKEVYDFILEDLQFAEANLPESNDVYATKYAAQGLLAMIHFQMNDFTTTLSYCDEVINSGLFSLQDTTDRFPMLNDSIPVALPNPETVFGTVSFYNDLRTEDLTGNYNSSGVVAPSLTLSSGFNTLMTQSGGDERLNWITQDGSNYYCNKYLGKTVFNVPIIYLTELKLIRAECLAQLDFDVIIAVTDINDIRDRAFGQGINSLEISSTPSEIMQAARNEYRKETIAEGKWIFQLKRLGALGLPIEVRGAPWNCPGMALQFPNNEFTGNQFVGNEEGGCN